MVRMWLLKCIICCISGSLKCRLGWLLVCMMWLNCSSRVVCFLLIMYMLFMLSSVIMMMVIMVEIFMVVFFGCWCYW